MKRSGKLRRALSVVCASVMAGASGSAAAEYVVQIGALSRANPGFAVDAMSVGTVMTSESEAGLIRYRVGPFASPSEARAAKAKLRAAGYPDAYIRRIQAPPAVSSAPLSGSESVPPGTVDISTLPEEVRAKLVYLDGELHIKEGEKFVPLSKYTR